MESWGRSAEQVLLSTVESNARVLGLISPDGNSGVTSLCRHVALASMRAGSRTLLADFAQPVLDDPDNGWGPGDGAAQLISTRPDSYDLLEVHPTIGSRGKFNNISALEELFNVELKAYDRIILDLPAVNKRDLDHINPTAAARASDMVLMVCMPGRITQGSIQSALSVLEGAGATMGGIVLNDLANPTLGSQMAASARRLSRLSRRFSGWLERKALASSFLNSRY